MKSDISKDTCIEVIDKLVTSPVFTTSKETQIKDKQEIKPTINSLQLDGKKIIKTKKLTKTNVQILLTDVDNTIEILVKNAKAVVCSRGMGGTTFYDVPYIYFCIGATELIRDNQLIIVDSARGEVYDPVALRT